MIKIKTKHVLLTVVMLFLSGLVVGCIGQKAITPDVDEQFTDIESRLIDINKDIAALNAEDSALASSEDITVWIDKLVLREQKYSLGETTNILVHVKRRDKAEGNWEGKITVKVGDRVKERDIVLPNRGDDYYDYVLEVEETGIIRIDVKVSDSTGVLDSKEANILVV